MYFLIFKPINSCYKGIHVIICFIGKTFEDVSLDIETRNNFVLTKIYKTISFHHAIGRGNTIIPLADDRTVSAVINLY